MAAGKKDMGATARRARKAASGPKTGSRPGRTAAASDASRTKAQLIEELARLRRRNARLEKAAERLAGSERLLEESEDRYRKVVAASPIGITVCDSTGQCVAANDSIAEMIGASREQVLKQNFHTLPSWKESGMYEIALRALETGETQYLDTRLFTTSFGRQVYLSCYMVPFASGGLLFMAHDRTAQKTAEALLERKTQALEEALRERDVLLTEIHHRVKNNLATISSMLQMQAYYMDEPRLTEVFSECQRRIGSMALVHEHLYGSGDFSRLGLRRYVVSLLGMLSEGYVSLGRKVSIGNRVDEMGFDMEQLISLGMIITEAVTNSLKHAFPSDRSGTVEVVLRRGGNGDAVLSVRDDGVGLPAGQGNGGEGSFGFRLMRIFAQQIGGTLEVDGRGGTAISVRFPREGNG